MSCPAQRSGSVEAHVAHFDAVYGRDDDPWQAGSCRDEAYKRRVVGYTLGSRIHARGLEVGCGNGISTCALAPKFLRLLAIDGSAGAVALAKARVEVFKTVDVERRMLPCAFPRGGFDAIIASEILYYLPPPKLLMMLRTIRLALRRGGLFVSAHHIRRFADAEVDHERLVRDTRSMFGQERRQLAGFGWRVYEHIKR